MPKITLIVPIIISVSIDKLLTPPVNIAGVDQIAV